MAAITSPIASREHASFMVRSRLCYPEAYHEWHAGRRPREPFSMPSPTPIDRRDFLKLAGAAAAAGPLAGQQMQTPAPMPGPMKAPAAGAKELSGTVFNLEIAPVT